MCDSPKGGVNNIRKGVSVAEKVSMSWGRCQDAWRGVTVVRKCDSYKVGVTSIRKVCQLMERCDNHGEM